MSQKRTLYQLRIEHGANIYDLSQASGVSSFVVWSMLIGRPVTRENATEILNGLNKLKGTRYTLDEIEVRLIEGGRSDAVHR